MCVFILINTANLRIQNSPLAVINIPPYEITPHKYPSVTLTPLGKIRNVRRAVGVAPATGQNIAYPTWQRWRRARGGWVFLKMLICSSSVRMGHHILCLSWLSDVEERVRVGAVGQITRGLKRSETQWDGTINVLNVVLSLQVSLYGIIILICIHELSGSI